MQVMIGVRIFKDILLPPPPFKSNILQNLWQSIGLPYVYTSPKTHKMEKKPTLYGLNLIVFFQKEFELNQMCQVINVYI